MPVDKRPERRRRLRFVNAVDLVRAQNHLQNCVKTINKTKRGDHCRDAPEPRRTVKRNKRKRKKGTQGKNMKRRNLSGKRLDGDSSRDGRDTVRLGTRPEWNDLDQSIHSECQQRYLQRATAKVGLPIYQAIGRPHQCHCRNDQIEKGDTGWWTVP